MANPVVIGDKPFSTQKAAKDTYKEILHRYPLNGEVTDPDDVQLLVGLVRLHRDPSSKIGSGIARFEVRPNPDYPGKRSFFIVRTDGSYDDFGYTNLIAPASHQQLVAQTMRHIIDPQVKAFAEEEFNKRGTIICPVDGTELRSRAEAHVDHNAPEFQELAGQFASLHGGWDAFDLVSKPNQIGKRFKDTDLSDQWFNYHQEHARLRIVSQRANLSLLRRGR